MPKLHFPQPEFTTHSCALPEGTTKLGRSSRNNLVLNDPSVSADHCEILVSWDEVIVRDHGSSNGTWVAGLRVNGQRPVKHGELIRFGRVEARLELDDLPVEDATAVTANFGAVRGAPAQSDPEPPQVIIGNGSSAPEDGRTTVSLPEPVRPVTPTVIATAKSSGPPTISPPGRTNRRRWVTLLGGVIAVATVAWLLRTFS